MSEDKKTELLPCPFCGGEARTRTTRKMNTNKDMRYYVECKDCYSSSNPWYDLGAKDTEAEAIETWNIRQPDKELIEALGMIAEGEADQVCNDGITRKSSLTYMQLTQIALEVLANYEAKK